MKTKERKERAAGEKQVYFLPREPYRMGRDSDKRGRVGGVWNRGGGQPAIIPQVHARLEGRPRLWTSRWLRTFWGWGGGGRFLMGTPSWASALSPYAIFLGHVPMPRTVPAMQRVP